MWQRYLECTPGCRAARPVTVEAKMHLIADAEQAFEMLVRRRGAQGRDGEIDAVTGESHDIHVSLDDNEAVDLP